MNAIQKVIDLCWDDKTVTGKQITAAEVELARLQRVEHLAGVLLYELDNDGDVQYIADAVRAALKGE